MQPLVSIIVPVYNAEKTIGRCIESILGQEYINFELLLMDDGSTDESGRICDSFAKNDTRIHVIHKENSGVSDTRNLALDLTQGKYLQFLDADDWITPNATRTFVEAAESTNADMVICDFYRVVDKRVSQKGSIDEEGLLTQEEYASHMMENPADFYYGVLWNKFYRRDIIEQHHLHFLLTFNMIRHSAYDTMREMTVSLMNHVKCRKRSKLSPMIFSIITFKTAEMSYYFAFEFLKRDIAYRSNDHSVGRIIALKKTT